MLKDNVRSAVIAGVIAVVCYLIFSALLAGVSIRASFPTSLLYGVGAFIITFIIASIISNRKNQGK